MSLVSLGKQLEPDRPADERQARPRIGRAARQRGGFRLARQGGHGRWTGPRARRSASQRPGGTPSELVCRLPPQASAAQHTEACLIRAARQHTRRKPAATAAVKPPSSTPARDGSNFRARRLSLNDLDTTEFDDKPSASPEATCRGRQRRLSMRRAPPARAASCSSAGRTCRARLVAVLALSALAPARHSPPARSALAAGRLTPARCSQSGDGRETGCASLSV